MVNVSSLHSEQIGRDLTVLVAEGTSVVEEDELAVDDVDVLEV